MTKIVRLEIENFRGIKELDWSLPDTNLVCLVGRGDSTKSTILEAIRLTLFPSWNPSFDEVDFHNCDKNTPLRIRTTFCGLPTEFISQSKYGNYLRGWNAETKVLEDEADDNLRDALTVELVVEESFEPKWKAVTDRHAEGKQFSAGDRARLGATFIGAYADRHLSWAKYSALAKLTETENISSLLSGAAESAKDALDEKRDTDLTSFDRAAKKVEKVALHLGVPVSSAYRAHLDITAVNIQLGGLTLHDRNLPLRMLGLGSRRMLTSGIQKASIGDTHITLIDEFEYGLEPHRIARLLAYLKEDDTGQYFITTHSPVVLRELTISELFITHSQDGKTRIVDAAQPILAGNIQGKVRRGAEAFLARKVIICEGATEVGFCRGLDNYWINQNRLSFSYQGVAMFDAGGGQNVRSSAEAIHSLGYDVCVIVDTDDHFTQADAEALGDLGVTVAMWEGGVALEEYVFGCIPWEYVIASVKLAVDIRGDGALDQVRHQFQENLGDIEEWVDSGNLRQAIGKAATGDNNPWFKRQDRGEEWATVVVGSLGGVENLFSAKIECIRSWIDDG